MVKVRERIVITDHNRIIAEIVPATEKKTELLEKYLAEQVESGKLSPATKRTTLDRKRSTKKSRNQKKLERSC